MVFFVLLAIALQFLLPRAALEATEPYYILFYFIILPQIQKLRPSPKAQPTFTTMADSADKPTNNNRGFYLAIAFGIIGLFLMMVVPCAIAMGVARCRERTQERRDALRRELEEGNQGDEATCGDAPAGRSPIFGVDEVGEASGWRHGDNDLETTSHTMYQDATILQHADGLVEVRKPEPAYGIGTCRVHGGRFQEHLPEAFERFPDQEGQAQMLEQAEHNEDSAEDSGSSYKGKGKEPLIVKRKEE
ncbi:hypothetical protein CCMA1212_004090 [Trichoderma ghanense]|uniref:SSCRP protein n=1 Tax=Trichoderma ghanense TaxID=65468 RepID=A0ABY2H7T6_9HYPO